MSALFAARALVAAVTDQQVHDAIDTDQTERWVRRERRRPRGAGRILPPTCPGCRVWVTNTNARCRCGWEPGVGLAA